MRGGAIIYENFLALPDEKQQRVRNAAFREFGRFGYKKTSAEQIAQAAGIAKGMVFHYFGSKQGLFEYLTDYANGRIDWWFGKLDDEIRALDYIEQYRRITKIKLESYIEEPHVFEFYTMLFMHPENMDVSDKVKHDYEKFSTMRAEALASLKNGKNTQLFRADIDREKAKKYIAWLVDGYSQQLLAALSGKALVDMDLDPYWKEFDEILDDMKQLFYGGNSDTATKED